MSRRALIRFCVAVGVVSEGQGVCASTHIRNTRRRHPQRCLNANVRKSIRSALVAGANRRNARVCSITGFASR